MKRIRYLITFIISKLPLNFFRIFFIDFYLVIILKNLKSDIKLFIEKFKVIGSMKIEIDEYSQIGSYNIFECASLTNENLANKYKRNLKIGNNILIGLGNQNMIRKQESLLNE